jgi:4,4'-diaponeurosporenoate glycosyltransferase
LHAAQPRAHGDGFMTATVVFCVTGWVLGWVVFGRPRVLAADIEPVAHAPAAATPAGLQRAIIIPARNEAGSLGGLLMDLTADRAATRTPLIIVVDDHSTDQTASIANAVDGVVVVGAPDLPIGWTGKSWACWNGVAAAQRLLGLTTDEGGDLQLVFIDADVRMAPGALDVVTGQQRNIGGLLSVQPHHVAVRPYEQLSALFNVIAIMGVGAGHSSPPTGAFGPVLATTFADYQRVGGHQSVRTDVAEDVALAQRYQDAGLTVNIRLGADLINFRMYPKGVRGLLEGWTKNFCAGALSTRYPTLAATVLWVTALGSATLGLVDGIAGQSLLLHAGIYMAFVAQLTVLLHRVGRFRWWTSVLYPVGLVTFFGVFVRSTWRTLVRRSTRWSGRTIDLTQRAAAFESELT